MTILPIELDTSDERDELNPNPLSILNAEKVSRTSSVPPAENTDEDDDSDDGIEEEGDEIEISDRVSPYKDRRKKGKIKSNTKKYMAEIEALKKKYPDKTPKEITDEWLESKRPRILGGMLDLAENAQSEASRRAMFERLKDELDGRPAQQAKVDNDDTPAVITLPSEM